MSKLKKAALSVLLLIVVYWLGPTRPIPTLNNEPLPTDELTLQNVQIYLDEAESQPNLKPGNGAEIVWANDSNYVQTEYAFVYLPGFGASKGEGEPIHREIAKRYGMNLFLARLEGQGVVEEEPFIDLEERRLVITAKKAVQIAKVLGKKVIIISCSTGSTLGLYLAANDKDIAGVVAYSPNIDLADPMSFLLTKPWGLQLAQLFLWSKYRGFEADENVKKWWINHYRIEGVVCLKSLVQNTMTDDIFKAIDQPVYMSYYYKNEEESDQIISIPKVKEAFESLATPKDKKRLVALSDVSGHCMASQFYSTEEQLDVVRKETFNFLEDALNLSPIQ